MPEGAEVRMNRDILRDVIKGKTLVEVELLSGKLQRKGVPGLDKLMLPQRITDVELKGKQILIRFADGSGILSTLGMSGWWYPEVLPVQAQSGVAYTSSKVVRMALVHQEALKHGRVALRTSEGSVAIYTDMRNFGNMTYYTYDELLASHPFDKLGFDLLNEGPAKLEDAGMGFWQAYISGWLDKFNRRPKLTIGELLLDQSFVCGLGNIYRAEVLYACGIHPQTPAWQLTGDDWTMIGWVAPYILDMAYDTQGTMRYSEWFMARMFGMKQGHQGHLVYGRRLDIRNEPITSEKLGARTMWYCEARQPQRGVAPAASALSETDPPLLTP